MEHANVRPDQVAKTVFWIIVMCCAVAFVVAVYDS